MWCIVVLCWSHLHSSQELARPAHHECLVNTMWAAGKGGELGGWEGRGPIARGKENCWKELGGVERKVGQGSKGSEARDTKGDPHPS